MKPKIATFYQARLLDNPSDPENSPWDALTDVDGDGSEITSEFFDECLEEAIHAVESRQKIKIKTQQDLTNSGLVIAKMTVEYILPTLPEKNK
jgi:hypothetical protein